MKFDKAMKALYSEYLAEVKEAILSSINIEDLPVKPKVLIHTGFFLSESMYYDIEFLYSNESNLLHYQSLSHVPPYRYFKRS